MKPFQARWTRFRIVLVFCAFLLAWGGLIWRAAGLQIHNRDRLVGIAEQEYLRKIKLVPIRGDIFDRHGEKLAVSLKVDSIYAEPIRLDNPAALATQLARILDLNRDFILKKLSSKAHFVWVKRQVDPDEAAAVRALEVKGIGFIKESKRFYPNLGLAAHVLGFVGVDAQGLEGLEVAYDDYFRGEATSLPVMRDALGRTFQDRLSRSRPCVKGASLTLTIDRHIQFVVEKALGRAMKDYNASYGISIVVRPRTGEVLALAVAPAYNPNAYRRYKPRHWRNIALTDMFDPGSTFKIFLVAAALEEGAVTPLDRFNCGNGFMTVGSRLIHDSRAYGWLTVNKIVKYSSNIGAVKIGQTLGSDRFYRYLSRFGFGSRTGIDLPGESGGLVRPYDKWTEIDAANIAFGQGISITAIQLVMAMSALANDGLLMRPFIVSKIIDSSGKVIKRYGPQIVRRVVSEQTAREVREMLRLVVEEGGTGTLAEPDGYPAAGKTGTAQKLDLSTRRYSKRKFVSSFVGFMPYDDPELAILVVLDEPWPKFFGGLVAAPAFKEIGEKVLPILNVAPRSRPSVLTSSLETKKKVRVSAQRKPFLSLSPGNKSSNTKPMSGITHVHTPVRVSHPGAEVSSRPTDLSRWTGLTPHG
ncbi:MAG: penicillin-binding protein 2 [Deltaproteobacteria bacterium]|nr:penicillin-binding protein 2 [Deltaproteobacteria bacterium]MBW2085207.1 penicillin-binding protein 2 [Deltaproteobacteria bacterium]